jgi:hypothetical protein
MRPSATSVCGLQLLVYEALVYEGLNLRVYEGLKLSVRAGGLGVNRHEGLKLLVRMRALIY